MSNLKSLEWNVENIRLTIFTGEKIQFTEEEWISFVSGRKPLVKARGERGGSVHFTEMVEDNNHFNLEVRCAGNRVDWRNISNNDDLMTACDIVEKSKIFLNKLKGWIENFEGGNTIVRVAFAIELRKPFDTEQESIECIKKFIPFFDVSSEFFNDVDLRVSKKRLVNNTETGFNEAITISAKKMISVRLDKQSMFPIPTPSVQNLCILKLDSNTFAESNNKISSVFDIASSLRASVIKGLTEGAKNE
jgi:hypothetical protein